MTPKFIDKVSMQPDDTQFRVRMVWKMKEEKKHILETYLILFVGVFLYFGFNYVVGKPFWDNILDSLVTFVICNIIIIWTYRKTMRDIRDNATQ